MATPNFTRRPTPAAVTPAAPTLPDGRPLTPGKVYLTPGSRKQLEAMGWKEGDPIPANLAAKVKEVQARYQAEMQNAMPNLPPDFKPKVPPIVDIHSLPVDAQQELRSFMAEAKAMGEVQQAQEAAQQRIEAQIPAGASPQVAEAIRASAAAQLAAEAQQRVQAAMQGPTATVETRSAKPLSFAAAQAAQEPPAPPVPEPPPSPPTPPEAAPPEQPEAPPSETGIGPAPISHCPRCRYNLRIAFDAHPTDSDRAVFMTAILGCTRFRKVVALLNDQLRITFRSLNSKEAELLYNQIRLDMQNGDILTDDEYMMKLQTYRLVMGVEKITARDRVLAEIPSALDVPFEQPQGEKPQTVLVPLTKWFWDEAVTMEYLRRVIGQQHREFQRLVEALEAQTTEPDFWKGIEPLN